MGRVSHVPKNRVLTARYNFSRVLQILPSGVCFFCLKEKMGADLVYYTLNLPSFYKPHSPCYVFRLKKFSQIWSMHLRGPFTNVSECDRDIQTLLIQYQNAARDKSRMDCCVEEAK